MTRKTTKKQARTLEYHRTTVQTGVQQHIISELEKQDYDKAIKSGVICIAAETDDMADVQV